MLVIGLIIGFTLKATEDEENIVVHDVAAEESARL
jgi:hypothetical protein